MAYTLVGSRYIGTGALPPPVAGYDAVDTTTGNRYDANTSATAWNLVGSVNQTNEGMLPLTGGTMTGAITGATGWAPLDSPNFTTSAKLGGLDLVTSTTLSTAITNVNNGISTKVTSAVASLSAGISVKGSVSIGTGILTFSGTTPQTIPLPTYLDGTMATAIDCKWVIGLVGGVWPCGRSDPNGDTTLLNTFTPSSNTGYCVLKDNGGIYYSTQVWYLIIAVKP